MASHFSNPFLSNTPQASPVKNQKGSATKPGTTINVSNSNNNSNHGSPLKNRIQKRPTSQQSFVTNPLLASPTRRRPRTSISNGSSTPGDRYIPSRTDIGLNSMASLSSSASLRIDNENRDRGRSLASLIRSVDHDDIDAENHDQVTIQKEKQAHETFDTILKNEIFGDLLSKDGDDNETGIDKIKNTTGRAYYNANSSGDVNQRPATPPPERRSSFLDSDRSPMRSAMRSPARSPVRSPMRSPMRSPRRRFNETLASGIDRGTSSDLGISSGHSINDFEESDFTGRVNSSTPATPRRRLFPPDDMCKPSSNTNRGASIFTYSERSTIKRPSSMSSVIQSSQFMDTKSPVRPDSKKLLLSPKKTIRKITKVPYRVLDAPSLADDFYYDLVDWSSKDFLAVALTQSVFLTNNISGEVIHLCKTDDEYTSLSWVANGTHLAVGQSNGLVEIYDVEKKKCIRTLSGHTDRVACLSWNNHVLSSGSRDRKILHRDVRIPQPFFQTIESHQQEVCGLKWNVNENKLASGGNDNVVNVYDGTAKKPFLTMTEHKAAVKAMAWSPHKRGILATGGGTVDRHLKIWNVNNQTKINDVDTGSQVCNMLWSKNTDEIVTSHGYSKFNLTIWDYPTLDPIAILKGHTFRVLHLTLSADGTTVVSGAGDETLRYWKLFDKPKQRPKTESSILSTFNQIR